MGFLLRNWHLKLGAVALATVLYTGIVFQGSFQDDTLQVPIRTSPPPSDVVVLTGAPGTVEVAYRVANEDAERIDADSFVASVDLSAYDMDRAAEPQVLPVSVESLVDGLQVVSADPSSVTVVLDRVDEKTIPVVVEYEPVPEGLDVDAPVLDVDEVVARGPASLLPAVDHAAARVLIDSSGIDVNRDVTLEAVDVEDQPVDDANIELTPGTVFVQIDVRTVETDRTVPVRPQVSGTPAAGFALEALTVEPSTVTLRGLPDVLAEVASIATEPLDIAGAAENLSVEAALVLPESTRLADESIEPVVTVTATITPSRSSATFIAGLECTGAGANACLPSLEQISVTLSGPGGALAAVSSASVTGILDVSGLGPGTHDVQVSLAALPQGVELEAISPGTVSVTIVAPATPAPTPTPAP
jgi:YbbR domain-containing protein